MRYLSAGAVARISRIGLGTWQFGSAEWGYGKPYADKEARAIVRRALELGVTLFDTAEIYGEGRSEEILGEALGDRRDAVVIATKMFPLIPSAAAVGRRAAASARRLGVDRIALYQVHYPNPLVSDRTLMRGMRAARRAGAIAEVGVSNYPLTRWRAAERSLGGVVLSNQVEYSLVRRAPERELLPFAEAHGRVIIAFSPLAMGLLSGRYHLGSHDGAAVPRHGARTGNPLFSAANLARTRSLIEVLRDVAQAHAATPAQIALAWLLRDPVVAAIPGAASVAQLESNVAAADIALTDDEYLALREASDRLGPWHDPAPSLRHCLRCARYVAKTARRA